MQCSGPGPFSTLDLFKSSFQIEPSMSAISPVTCLPAFSRLPCLQCAAEKLSWGQGLRSVSGLPIHAGPVLVLAQELWVRGLESMAEERALLPSLEDTLG